MYTGVPTLLCLPYSHQPRELKVILWTRLASSTQLAGVNDCLLPLTTNEPKEEPYDLPSKIQNQSNHYLLNQTSSEIYVRTANCTGIYLLISKYQHRPVQHTRLQQQSHTPKVSLCLPPWPYRSQYSASASSSTPTNGLSSNHKLPSCLRTTALSVSFLQSLTPWLDCTYENRSIKPQQKDKTLCWSFP